MPQPAAASIDISRVEAAILELVPQPPDTRFSVGIADAILEVAQSIDWLLPELTAYSPALAALEQYVAAHPDQLDTPLPSSDEPEYPILRALAAKPSTEKLEDSYTALMLVVAAHAAHLRRTSDVNSDAASEAADTLAKKRNGLSRSDVYRGREAFLRAIRQSRDSLECAVILESLFNSPQELPPGVEKDAARPDTRHKDVLRNVVIPLLSGATLTTQSDWTEEDTTPDEWELDDTTTPTTHLQIPSSAQDDGVDDEVTILTDKVTRREAQELNATSFWDPTRVPMSQSIHSTNDHLITLHADVITPEEARTFASTWFQAMTTALDEGKSAAAAELGVLGLMLACGLTKERAAMAMHPKARLQQPARYLTTDCNFLISPVLGPRTSSTDVDADALEEPYRDQQIALPLPPALALQLRRLRELHPRMAPPMTDRPPLESALRALAESCGFPSITIGRLRRFPSVCIFEYSRDLPATMILCGDTFRHSRAPLHYACWSADRLEEMIRASIWRHWPVPDEPQSAPGPFPAPAPRPAGLPTRIGSTHHDEVDGLATIACPKVGGQVHKQTNTPLERAILAHNQIGSHLGAAFIGVAGHRPSEALFRLTSMDIDPNLGIAIISDKEIDPTHLTRLIALGSKLTHQYKLYIAHLQSLLLENLDKKTKKRIKAAISGRRPLLFGLEDSGEVIEWTLERWRKHLPEAWVGLKTNYSRHSLATLSRDKAAETSTDSNWTAIQLGHYDHVGFPFSPDSPTYPSQLSKMVGPLLDHLFDRHGWRHRTGLAGYDSSGASLDWKELGPLGPWMISLQKHERRCKDKLQKFRQYYLTSTFRQRSDAEGLLIDVLQPQVPELATLLAREFNAIRSRRAEPPLELPELEGFDHEDLSVELKQDRWLDLLELIDLGAGKREALRVAARNRLVIGLRRIKQTRKYRGIIPAGYPYRAMPDPSPFPRSMCRATQQIALLRQHFRTLTSPIDGTDLEKALWLLGKTILAWVIYGQITDAAQITSLIASGKPSLDRLPASPSSLLVHLDDQDMTLGFSGPGALAHAQWIKKGAAALNTLESLSLHTPIEDALRLVLPPSAQPEKNVFSSLLETMGMMNRIEQTGFQRHCLTPETGSVCFAADRCREYIRSAEIRPRPAKEGKASTALKRSESVNAIQDALDELLNALPGGSDVTILKRTGQSIQPGIQRFKPARSMVAKEIEQWIKDETQPTMVKYVASWLHYTVLRPRYRGSDKELEWGTVKDYFGLVKKAIVNNIGWLKADEEADAEELEALYIRAIEGERNTSRERDMAVQLLDFHSHLETNFEFDDVDRCLFLPYLPRSDKRLYNVSADVVLPEEASAIQRLMEHQATPTSATLPGTNIRLLQQAAFAHLLIQLTGARIAEVAGLQHRDIILTKDYIYIILRANGYRGVKTPAARRLVPLKLGDRPHLSQFADWVANERTMRGVHRVGRTYLFTDWSTGNLVGRERLGTLLRSAIHLVNAHVGIHHNRHYHVTDGLASDELGCSPRSPTPTKASCVPRNRLPRDMAARAYFIGHRRPRTSGRCYMHFPAAFSISSQMIHHATQDTAVYACAFGISPDGWRKINGEADPQATALDRACKLRKPKVPSDLGAVKSDWVTKSSVARYCNALNSLYMGHSEDQVCLALGLSPSEIDGLLDSANKFAANSSIQLDERGKRRPAKQRRWRAGSQALQDLWRQIEVRKSPRHLNLLELIRLALRGKPNRKHLAPSPYLAQSIRELAPTDYALETDTADGQIPKIVVSHKGHDITREYIWTCVIGLVVKDMLEHRAFAKASRSDISSGKPSASGTLSADRT